MTEAVNRSGRIIWLRPGQLLEQFPEGRRGMDLQQDRTDDGNEVEVSLGHFLGWGCAPGANIFARVTGRIDSDEVCGAPPLPGAANGSEDPEPETAPACGSLNGCVIISSGTAQVESSFHLYGLEDPQDRSLDRHIGICGKIITALGAHLENIEEMRQQLSDRVEAANADR